MPFSLHPPTWHLRENHVTSESAYFTRRHVLKTLLGFGVSASILPLTGCKSTPSGPGSELEQSFQLPKLSPIRKNPDFREGDRPLTTQNLASQYNNFYEFGGTKSIWKAAQTLPTNPWTLAVTGLVKNPRTYDLDDLRNTFDLEERIYRFRCVEAWSMVLPWVGFPMRKIIEAVEPTSNAKFVRFTSFYDEKITPGPGFHLGSLPWPYQEGLRIEEMANDLAFFAVGIYGKELPKQHGAPIRAVLPWKYGFKGAKSIVKIEFVAEQPATYWNSLIPNEYGFEANVNPGKPHPRWSQATERFIGPGTTLDWEMKETLLYNGYAEQVGGLYRL
ncbi:protein-methionine-sulfoxide reductase catalytic subunit MsrP [Spirulina major]|uniref:protein-methionine-sulfoxide reductase catalytic subunit MsrP n=1 Tax=Spirulina major TaxID=270636 RepID=UPI000934E425|nr:protein-methionine-sulfoxide reductase catalytic subunit MsrP [Spirulina major]